MGVAVKASLVLVGLVGLLSVGTIAAGLHKAVPAGALFFIAAAIIINVVVVLLALRKTASENGYGAQLLNALVIGALGGAMIFGFSILNTTVIFPGSLEESREAQLAFIESADDPPELRDARIQRVNALTPVSQAIPGAIGAFVTSLIAGAITAAFQRKS
jgi:hypothetical protein